MGICVFQVYDSNSFSCLKQSDIAFEYVIMCIYFNFCVMFALSKVFL